MFKLTVDPQDAPDEAAAGDDRLRARRAGERSTAERLGPVKLIEALNQIAGAHGVGRLDLVENRLVGMKSRGVYETPAGTVLHIAHRELERLVLDRDTLHFKQSVSVRYAQLIYDGLWFSTLREALAALRGRDREGGDRRGARPALQGHAPRPSGAARRAASTARTSRPSARAWPTTTRTPRASSSSSACPSASAR